MRASLLTAARLAALLAAGCSDATAPRSPLPLASVTLDFCTAAPIWLAIKNEGEDWREITAGTSGAYTFDATTWLSVAFVHGIGSFSTTIYNVTRDELEILAPALCREPSGTKSISGSIAGVAAGEWMQLSMAPDLRAYADPNAPSFSVQRLADAPTDLVATRMTSDDRPDRVIVRRGLNLPSGTTIPTLDFASGEARPIMAHTVTIANGGSDRLSMFSEFISANGTSHYLGSVNVAVGGSTAATVAVPATLHVAGDLHRLFSYASGDDGNGRDVTVFDATPGGNLLTLGPILNIPQVSSVASAYLRPRISIASQREYPSAMEAHFFQHNGCAVNSYTILTSAGFVGRRPETWEIEFPDMSQAGYETLWAPKGTSFGWQTRGVSGDSRVIFRGAPRDGDVIRQAFRAGGV